MVKKTKTRRTQKADSTCDYGKITTWKKAKDRLDAGNTRYKTGKLEHPNQLPECREQWTGTQSPWCVVLSCADSRVTPELVFDTGIGELFVVRVAGNIANASSLASIEYAVAKIKTKEGKRAIKGIVVLGHEGCGAVNAAIEVKESCNAAPSPALQHLVGHIMPALEKKPTGKDKIAGYVRANAKLAGQDLFSRSKIIRESKLPIVPAYYRLKSGDVQFLPEIKCK